MSRINNPWIYNYNPTQKKKKNCNNIAFLKIIEKDQWVSKWNQEAQHKKIYKARYTDKT